MTIDTSTEAVERLLEDVTPGPWRHSKSYRGIVSDSPSGYDDAESVSAYGGHMICESVMAHNSLFIAAARELVPALLADRDVWRDKFDHMAKCERDQRYRAEAAEAERDRLATAHAQMQQTLDRMAMENERLRNAAHFNSLTPAEAERLAMLAEECGEVIQVIGKILRHGYDSYHPADPHTTNRQLLGRELNDLYAVSAYLCRDKVPEMSLHDQDRAWARKLRFAHHQEEVARAGQIEKGEL